MCQSSISIRYSRPIVAKKGIRVAEEASTYRINIHGPNAMSFDVNVSAAPDEAEERRDQNNMAGFVFDGLHVPPFVLGPVEHRE